MDTLTKDERSRRMSLIRSVHTTPEIIVRRSLRALGYSYRLHRRDLPGVPDIVVPSNRVAIFVHGCFWHQHPGCPDSHVPKTRKSFWRNKFSNNLRRDRRNASKLRKMGWRVLQVRACELRNIPRMERRIKRFLGEPDRVRRITTFQAS
ncbi:MAG TPA: very short patch repair endonuclease [Phycisphaerae bacterium]|nr:very short patch repair endonuclease [Phycisphaerae bacterium]